LFRGLVEWTNPSFLASNPLSVVLIK
jgi:hypothetical protein